MLVFGSRRVALVGRRAVVAGASRTSRSLLGARRAGKASSLPSFKGARLTRAASFGGLGVFRAQGLGTVAPRRSFSSAAAAARYRLGGDLTSRRGRPHFGIVMVPAKSAYIIERFGAFHRTLAAGLNFLIPVVDRIAYVQSLKEEAIPIPNQMGITADNVTLNIDGVLYLRVVDPVGASYGVEDPIFAVTQLAQTTMRSEVGKITLDTSFRERQALNDNIVDAINLAAADWGIKCLRYEIRDISPTASVRQAMDMQAEAERKKRAQILDSEGAMQSEINMADGHKQGIILQAEAEAAALLKRAEATALGIKLVSESMQGEHGSDAVAMRVAEQYLQAFSHIAKESTTMLLPANAADPAAFIAQSMGIYEKLRVQTAAQQAQKGQQQQHQEQQQGEVVSEAEFPVSDAESLLGGGVGGGASGPFPGMEAYVSGAAGGKKR